MENGTPTYLYVLSTFACFYHSYFAILFYLVRQGILGTQMYLLPQPPA